MTRLNLLLKKREDINAKIRIERKRLKNLPPPLTQYNCDFDDDDEGHPFAGERLAES